MKVNGKEIIGKSFFYDGCHKIYVIEDDEDVNHMKEIGWSEEQIYPISYLPTAFYGSCSLRFIHNVKLTKTYVKQFEDAEFSE